MFVFLDEKTIVVIPDRALGNDVFSMAIAL